MEHNNPSVVVATLPGGFTGAVFALAQRHRVALLGVVAAHTSLRALWAGLKERYRTPMIEAPGGDAYLLAHDLEVVAKGTQGKAEWQLLASPGVVPADEDAVRAYVGRRWPLPPDPGSPQGCPLLPALAEYGMTTLVGGGSYLDLPRLDSTVWHSLIRRATVGEYAEEAL